MHEPKSDPVHYPSPYHGRPAEQPRRTGSRIGTCGHQAVCIYAGTTVRARNCLYCDTGVDQAYDGFGDTYKLYSEIFHRDSIDGQGLPLLGYVHYGNGFNNAFWDGAEMVFGDGDGIIFQSFTRSLDVIGHELAHGVTEKTAGLVYHNQPGALNESFSDVFGSLVKQYKLKQNAASADWLIGAELLAPGIHGKALRSMADPGSAYNDPKLGGKDPQPGHMKDYVNLPDNRSGDWGGVHYNSGIPNHAFYLLATRLGGNAWDVPGKIWYTALQQLNSNSQFQDCAEITCQVASTIYGNGSTAHQATIEAWDEVGLSFSGAQDRFAGRKKVGKNKAPTFNNDVLKQQLEKLAEALENTIEAMA